MQTRLWRRGKGMSRRKSKTWAVGLREHEDPREVMGTDVQGHRSVLKTVSIPGGCVELGGGNYRKLG